MEMFFCKSWFRAKKRPIEEWSEERARVAHERGELYTVLVGSTAEPWCFLEVTGQFVGVGFLDRRLRETLSYDFQAVIPVLNQGDTDTNSHQTRRCRLKTDITITTG